MRHHLAAIIILAVFSCGCIGGAGEKIEVSSVSIAKSKPNGYSYAGTVTGLNSGAGTYKFCVLELRTAADGSVRVGTAEKSAVFGPGSRILINVDDRFSQEVTAVSICCYKSESYSGSPTCSDIYAIPK